MLVGRGCRDVEKGGWGWRREGGTNDLELLCSDLSLSFRLESQQLLLLSLTDEPILLTLLSSPVTKRKKEKICISTREKRAGTSRVFVPSLSLFLPRM